MTPIMSAVIHTPTTPIRSTCNVGASKRKDLSPSVNVPPVAGDNSLRTLESAAVTLPAIAPLQNSNILSSPIKTVGALDVSTKLSQNPTLTQISGQKKKKQQ